MLETKVLICVPTRGFVYYKVAEFIAQQREMGFGSLFCSSSYGTEAARKKLTNVFLKFDYSHLFFLDDDVLPPKDIVAKLLNVGGDVVTADYPMMDEDMVTSHCSFYDTFGELKRFPFAEKGLKPVDKMGMGCCLIKKEVIAKHKDDFEFKFDNDGNAVESEDYYFCKKVKEGKIEIICDFDIKCLHFKTIPLKGGG